MSFGTGGGFSFGSNTNNNQSPGFGGFGSNTNTTPNTGFGANTSNTGFGSNTAASNPFGGGGGGGNGGSTFGSNTGGFGNNTNSNTSGSLFGNKPASNPFGASSNTGGGLFGSSTTQNNAGFRSSTTGGFGNTTTGGGFGGNTSGSAFSFGNAANKPAFGSTDTSTPLFGQGGSGTTGGFGSSTFGAAGTGTALSNQPVPPSDGTAATPFTATLEKDASGQSNNYQSINFMAPYQKYSFEELRLADYNAGRRFGNNTGTAGGFGSSTFGGFGSSNTPAFGNNNNTASTNPFGSTTTSSATGFASNTSTTGFGGGGLFGNKPAAGGLFGQQQQSSGTSSGGLFGTAGASTGGFGSGTPGFGSGAAPASGGGLFGNQTQNKPGGLFGNTAATSAPSFSFGNAGTTNTNTGTGLFGNNSQQQQQQQQSGGVFGNTGQQKSLFGNATGGFGASTTQSQPSGGLFGSSNTGSTGGGLFGNTPATNAGGGTGLFGGTASNTGTSLFGNNNANNAPKPGGLFGGSTFGNNTNTNTSGGLFGNANQNQQQGGGGFSFGNATNKPATTSLFGNTGNQQQGGLFGSTGGNNSVFGNAQNNQQSGQQQPDFKQSSLNDPNPYGQTSIWTGLPVPTPENAKPLFTPLSATQKMKESQAKPPPSLRLSQSRYMTPPRRSGFGFSYSTYGTPNSAASTPGGSGLASSMYGSRSFTGGSFGRSFGKSASASNLRSQFSGDGESVLGPNAFATSSGRWSSGNMRRLTIDRSIRNDLFSRSSLPTLPTNAPERPANDNAEPSTNGADSSTEPANKLKKRVSFDKGTVGGQEGALNGQSGALVRTETNDDHIESGHRGPANGTATPEAEPSRDNQLEAVPEDRESDHVSPQKSSVHAKSDPQPGDYWMKPTRAELSKLPRDKLQRFTGFEAGRKGCGKVVFNGPVDLTAIPLDDLYEKIVEIRLRSVTVYPDASSKPPVGKGLNVPSTISIENSWPRSRGQPSSATSGPVFEKHVNRLKKMHGTEFVNYEVSTGVWTFRVPHYTRYGLDYDEDEELGQSQFSAPPESLNGSHSGNVSAMEVDSDGQYDAENDEDDTFAFKQKSVPGGFGRRSAINYDADIPTAEGIEEEGPDFEMADESEYEETDNDNQVDMAGSFPGPGGVRPLESPTKPILKANRTATPGKALISLEGDWAEQLQQTISPRKQDREALRNRQSVILLDRAYEPIKPQPHSKKDFRTSIDIMNSLFNRHEERMAKGRNGQAGPDLEFPYAKRTKTFDDDEADMTENDKLWHASFKPRFTETNKLVYKLASTREAESGWTTDVLVESENGTVEVTSLEGTTTRIAMDTKQLLIDVEVKLVDKVPFVKHSAVPFSRVQEHVAQGGPGTDELDIYELAHVLFDDHEDEFSFSLNPQQKQDFQTRIYKDRLSKYLGALVWRRHGEQIKAAEKVSAATAAVLHLTARNVKAACDVLMKDKNFHLMLLVSQIEQADETFQSDIANQIAAWHEQGIISEVTEEIRALYEILAGNTTISQGKQTVPVEDKATTISISEKFELDWIQAFCLCLWYGQQKNGDIYDAVKDFQEQLATKQESASPIAENGDEDPLWVLLKLFASRTKGKAGSGIETPIFPQALSSLSQPWSSQTAFRLHHAIAAAMSGIKVDQDKTDALAISLGFEQSARGNLIGAVYALLHVGASAKRSALVRDLLNKYAAALPSPPDVDLMNSQAQVQLWSDLTGSLKIPASWICRAKALFARSTNASLEELSYLILAQDFSEAHECLLQRVAPRLVVDEDWDTLHLVLTKFGDKPEENVDRWKSGGGVYTDFVTLVELTESLARRPSNTEADSTRKTLLHSLQGALTGMNAKFVDAAKASGSNGSLAKDKENLEQRVALCEMGRAVARALELDEERGLGDKKPILDLPLTADARLSHARALGVDYYRGVMAMAR
ncbi:nuclear protein 96-domain-containing protein [Exophiala viscosa]|uniref:Nuclear protein 96-domain-containing protein n=1 Tax=Exophiala viscosa TaxID=2486360 RepID=A0AAN6I9U2_9EURO|nr:nuclear protein 96-domain-containing protein [Exophiala viscosa]KAI1628343.1 nuclear protein 96-domain-containing protein [Exophiala viscosa]